MRKLTTIDIYCDEAGNSTEQLRDLHVCHKTNANAAAVAAKLRMEQREQAEQELAKDRNLAVAHHTRKMFNRWRNVVRRRKAETKSANDKKLREFFVSELDPLWRRQSARGGSEEASYLERKNLLLDFLDDGWDYSWREMELLIAIPPGKYVNHSCPPIRFADFCHQEWVNLCGKHFCLHVHQKDLKENFLVCLACDGEFAVCLVFPNVVKSIILISFVSSRIKNEKAFTALLKKENQEEDESTEKYLNSRHCRSCYDDYDENELFQYGRRSHHNFNLFELRGARILKKQVLPFLTFDEAIELSHRDLSGKVHGGPIITRVGFPHTYSLLTQLLY